MAVFSSSLVVAADAPVNFTLATVTASAEQAPGTNKIVSISATNDLYILWGPAGAVGTPSAVAGFRLPANNVMTFDTGISNPSFKVFNSGGTTATITYMVFSRF